ncbi:unnamed protein product [Urochloa humidicola]
MAKLTALTSVVLLAMVAATTIVSSVRGARTLVGMERVAIPTSFVASPYAVDDVDFDIPFEEAAADDFAATGADAWDAKTPVFGRRHQPSAAGPDSWDNKTPVFGRRHQASAAGPDTGLGLRQ